MIVTQFIYFLSAYLIGQKMLPRKETIVRLVLNGVLKSTSVILLKEFVNGHTKGMGISFLVTKVRYLMLVFRIKHFKKLKCFSETGNLLVLLLKANCKCLFLLLAPGAVSCQLLLNLLKTMSFGKFATYYYSSQ